MTDNPFPQSCAERFQAVKLIGTGGFGAVWLAEQKDLGRLVAVKTSLSSQIPDQEHIQRFIQEARATSRLEHPNIVRLIDYGVEGHRPWLVYEYIEGQSVSDYMRKHALSWQDAVRIVRDTALGLAYAHQNGIIHRDIKPDNLLLDRSGSLKIIDFGIAKWNSRQGFQTEAGLVLGTLEYMSPDQLRGKESSPQFDLYSLGVTFFQLLTGRLPFVHESKQEVIRMHLKVLAPVPSSVVPGIPAALDRIVSTCLAKTEKNRYPGLKELIEELEGLEVSAAASPSATIDLSISRVVPKLSTRTVTRTSVATAKVTPAELAPRGISAATIAVICVTCLVVGAVGAWWVLRDDGFRADPPPPSAPAVSKRDTTLLRALQQAQERSRLLTLEIASARTMKAIGGVEELNVVADIAKVRSFYSRMRERAEALGPIRESLETLRDSDPWWLEFHDAVCMLHSCLHEMKGTVSTDERARQFHGGTLLLIRERLAGDSGAPGSLRELCLRDLRIRQLRDEENVLEKPHPPEAGWPVRWGAGECAPLYETLLQLLENPRGSEIQGLLSEWELLHYRGRISRLYLSDAFALGKGLLERNGAYEWAPTPAFEARARNLVQMVLPYAEQARLWTGPEPRFAYLMTSALKGLDDAARASWKGPGHRELLVQIESFVGHLEILIDNPPPVGRAGPELTPFDQDLRAALRPLKKDLVQAMKRL